ncbi:hypothetical protein [Streptomyces sp. NPDC056544]|uniref:hypothetical protein n=1 Tax=unclassified Streptomyces TaxID=2593676 RepID=UPI00368A0EAB
MASTPVETWTAAGAPELLELLTGAGLALARYNSLAAETAERIGDTLVARDDVTKQERAHALKVRRSLHRDASADFVDWPRQRSQLDRLTGIARGLTDTGNLAEVIARTAEAGTLAERQWQAAEAAVHAEARRTGDLPWRTVQVHPPLWRTLTEDHPGVLADIRQRLARGERWDSKYLRKRSDFLWRLITRAATKTTPRGWLTHVAPLALRGGQALDPDAGPGCSDDTTVPDVWAVHRVENLHTARQRALPSEGTACDHSPGTDGERCIDVRVSLAPLYRLDEEALTVWAQRERGRLQQLRIRHTEGLSLVVGQLVDGPRPWHDLIRALTGGKDEGSDAWSRFLQHLVTTGVLQTQGTAHETGPEWQPAHARPDTDAARPNTVAHAKLRNGAEQDPAPVAETAAVFTDVYRAPTAFSFRTAHADLQELMGHAARLADLLYDEAGPSIQDTNVLTLLDGEARPVLDILHDFLAGNGPEVRSGEGLTHGRWPRPRDPDSPYGRLIQHLSRCAASSGPIDLGPSDLDRLGVPGHSPLWPMTAMLRPSRSPNEPAAVLDAVMPTGVLDSRFAGALAALHPDGHSGAEYRAFLRGLEARSGATFVEICAPSLGTRSANAVRRPEYTSFWTGDTDRTHYFAPLNRRSGMRHIALGDITMRREGDRPIAEAGSRTLWPVLHATKGMEPPWDTLGGLLLAAGPRRLLRPFKLSGILAALPHLQHFPRVTLGGRLVVACAQWRVPVDEILPAGVPLATQMRQLADLCVTRGIPRWVFVSTRFGGKPVAVDLCSVLSPRLLGRMAADAPTSDFVFEEMLPQPGESPFREERGARLVAEVAMGFPGDPTGDELAGTVHMRLGARLMPKRGR